MRTLGPVLMALLFAGGVGVPCASAREGGIPIVDVVVFRLDVESLALAHVYRFDDPFRKGLAPEGYTDFGEVFCDYEEPSDFGHVRVLSRVTSDSLFSATSVFMGTGEVSWPTADVEVGPPLVEPVTVSPATFTWFSPFGSANEDDARSAWESVRNTDLVARLAERQPYDVFAFDFALVADEFRPTEWVVIVVTHPPAPRDLAVLKTDWPRTLMTRSIATLPEITVHNFGDEPAGAHCEVTFSDGAILYRSEREAVVAADDSHTFAFDAYTPDRVGDLALTARVTGADGSEWGDAYADNDEEERPIYVTRRPVFRVVSSIARPGVVPLRSAVLDFDADGDADLLESANPPRLWRNTGDGTFEDATSLIAGEIATEPTRAWSREFTGDERVDLLVTYGDRGPQLFAGDEGGFHDVTVAAGLDAFGEARGVRPCDVDSDGDLDLLIALVDTQSLARNDGGTFSDASAGSGLEDLATARYIATGSVVGPYDDLAVARWGAPSSIYLNYGNGTFGDLALFGASERMRMTLVYDYDGDGRNEVLFVGEMNELVGHRGFYSFEDYTDRAHLRRGADAMAAGDWDSDGDLDLVAGHLRGLDLLRRDGDRYVDHSDLLVDQAEHVRLGGFRSSPAAEIIDLDRDGDLDLYTWAIVFENLGADSTGVTPIGPDEEEPAIPPAASLKVAPVSPNPATHGFRVDYVSSSTTVVSMELFDVRGALVASRRDRPREAGRHVVRWEVRDPRGRILPPGVYVLRLRQGSALHTERVVIVS
jgi:hypothetical protein